MTATFFPAGHVLGAASIGLSTPEGNVLFTGDLSVDAQRTVPGMMPPRFRPHVVVCESTYGGRLHASRSVEEKRLVEAVEERIRSGGKVLVPGSEFIRKLVSARLASDVLGVPTLVVARTDADAAQYLRSDIDPADQVAAFIADHLCQHLINL